MKKERDHRHRYWPKGWPKKKATVPTTNWEANRKQLVEWMDYMVEWGKNVRDDIIRLESGLGVGAGDPGDPPPTPWGEEDDPTAP